MPWRDASVQVLMALLVLMERERLGVSRGEVLLCAEVSEHGRDSSFLRAIGRLFILS